MKRTQFTRIFARFLALCSLGALAAVNAGGCAEDSKVDAPAGAAGSGGGPTDPCLEPIVPYLWFFTNDIAQDSRFPLFVVPQSSFRGILGVYGKTQEEGKGHIIADARSCLGDPTKDYPSADGVNFTLAYGARDPIASNFYLNPTLQADAFATQTSALSIGGFLNVDALAGRIAVTPLDLGKQIASQKNIVVRANYLTTLRMDPSVDAPKPSTNEEVAAIPERWSCVGSVPSAPKTTQASLRINVTALNFASGGQDVAPKIGFSVCSPADLGCAADDSLAPDYVSNEKGEVSIDVKPDADGVWRGFLVVKGQVRKLKSDCALPK